MPIKPNNYDEKGRESRDKDKSRMALKGGIAAIMTDDPADFDSDGKLVQTKTGTDGLAIVFGGTWITPDSSKYDGRRQYSMTNIY